MSTIKPIIKILKKNKKGERTVAFKIGNNKEVKLVFTNITIQRIYWDNIKRKVKRNHPNSNRLNAKIQVELNKLEKKILDGKERKKTNVFKNIINEIIDHKPIELIPYAESILNQYLSNGQIGTHDKNKSVLNKIKKYLEQVGNTKFLLVQINNEFIEGYENYIRTTLKNKTNTVSKDLKFIKKIINQAIQEGIVELVENPFMNIKIKSEKNTKTYFNELEINQICNFPISHKSKADLYRDIFIFSCECGGIRISDLVCMKKNDYDGTYLDFSINKTSTQIHLKVPNKAKKIIEKYIHDDNINNLLFPIKYRKINWQNNIEVDRFISTISFSINRSIKETIKNTGITKPFSFHSSRHTFATRALLKGIPIEVVQKILGHASVKETIVYTQIINTELDKAMDLFEG